MTWMLLAARTVLATVFAVAGAAKLADRAGSRQAVIDFGVPARVAPAIAIMLPLGELLVAGALLLDRTARAGAAGALALLVSFLAAIALNLWRGRVPECHCFGQLGSAPIGWRTIARNLFLAGVAGLVLWHAPGGGPSGAARWTGASGAALPPWAALVASLSAAAAVLAWLFLPRLARNASPGPSLRARGAGAGGGAARHGAHAARPTPRDLPQGLPVGTPAPAFELRGADGRISLADLQRAGLPVILLFLSPSCWMCAEMVPELVRWQREYTGKLTLAIVSHGTEEENRRKFGEPGLPPVLLQQRHEVSQRYLSPGTPAAVLVRVDGRIGSRVVMGYGPIQRLLLRAAGAPLAAERAGVPDDAESTLEPLR